MPLLSHKSKSPIHSPLKISDPSIQPIPTVIKSESSKPTFFTSHPRTKQKKNLPAVKPTAAAVSPLVSPNGHFARIGNYAPAGVGRGETSLALAPFSS